MGLDHEARLQRIDDCRELYLKYEGQEHELIEQEMRARGHTDFHRRVLYRRFERGACKEGWINRFGFDHLVRQQKLKAKASAAQPLDVRRSYASPYDNPNRTGGYASDGGIAPDLIGEADEKAEPFRASSGTAAMTVTSPDSLDSLDSPDPSNDFPEFLEWLKAVSPTMTWEWKHQVYIYKRLKRVDEGLCKRLMIFLPPRHGKSELVTVRYSAWRLKQDPSLNVILGSYTQRLANRFSRKIRRVLCDDASTGAASIPACPALASDGVKRASIKIGNANINGGYDPSDRGKQGCLPLQSPFPFISQRPANSEAEWETSAGGGLRAVGVGSGVTGFGAGLIIIDDPVKSRAEAESQTYRDNIWDWFNDDLYTRLEPNGAIILIQTRWHEDDLAGRLLRESAEEGAEQWEVVNLPALAEQSAERSADTLVRNAGASGVTNEGITNVAETPAPSGRGGGHADKSVRAPADPLNRQPGEALCPERYNEEALEKLRRKLGSYSFAALYQQTPVPAEGGLFKREWFKHIVAMAPPGLKWKRGYDLAVSSKTTSDYTASLRVAFDKDGTMYIDGGYRARIEYPEQRKYILGRIAAERDTEHGVELSANGTAVIQDLRREKSILGRAFRGVVVKGDKVTRALPWIALAEEGRVRLVRGSWNTEFIEEACSFPQGTHDDQIDAVSIAVRMHRERRGRLYTF